MLQISDGAVTVLDEARETQGVPETFGVRVFGQRDVEGRVQVHLAFTEEPEEGDHVIEESGTEIYLAPEVAEPLQTAVIDVEGSELVIRPQDES